MQYLSVRYTERLAETGAWPRSGRRATRYDNAMAESVQRALQGRARPPAGPWRGLDDLEFATLEYVDWYNNRRLHGEITADPGYTTPAEFEAAYYRQATAPPRGSDPSPAVTRPGAVATPVAARRGGGRAGVRTGGRPR